MLESFKNCGWASFLMLFVGLLGLGASLLALGLTVMKRPVGGIIAAGASVLFALMSFGAGPIGAMYGRQVTDHALDTAGITATDKERIRQIGYAEADSCIAVGVSLGSVPLVAGLLSLAVALRAKKKLASIEAKGSAPSPDNSRTP